MPASSTKPHDTPAMRQFRRFKELYPDCVLFFRMGDFYEMFYDDATLAHKVLGVTLTQRTEGVPMAGVPYHAVDNYLRRMIQAGYRVAVCDQVEDPKQAKGVVKRDVTRVITPGTLTDEHLLDEGRSAPLAAVMFHGEAKQGKETKAARGGGANGKRDEAGTRAVEHASLAWAELSTGSFSMATFTLDELADELARIAPSELLYCETANSEPPPRIRMLTDAANCPAAPRPAWQFRHAEAVETLCKQYGVATLAGFGLTGEELCLGPAGAIVSYLLETQCAAGGDDGAKRKTSGDAAVGNIGAGVATRGGGTTGGGRIAHLQPPKLFERAQHLIIDQTSLRSLEIERTIRAGSTDGSLLGALQGCRTAMGKRMLRQWLCYPLADRSAIEARQRVVGAMVEDTRFGDDLRDALAGVQDVQRIVSRIAVGRALPRDLVALGASTAQAKTLTHLLAERPSVQPYHDALASIADALNELSDTIVHACVESPPAHLREGGLFQDGHDRQLDESRALQRDSNAWLAEYQKQLIEETGVASLKVGYNKVFGYYIELSAANRDKAPDAWSRKQTLKNAERYITPQLKEYEGKVLSAKDRAVAREQELFARLCAAVQQQLPALHALADTVAQLDVLACFARQAVKRRYVKPQIVDEPALHIVAGRHPVLDQMLKDQFVPNDVELGSSPQSAVRSPQSAVRGPRSEEDEATTGDEADADDATSAESPREAASGKRRNQKSRVKNHESDSSSSADRGPRPADSSPSSTADRGPRTADSSPTLALITGPNMAGKSTYIRQAALITLMAHTGSFVPAERATVGLCDRIFTRIGASDELHAGQSTFMVEMTETANICHHASQRSLVILDEIGRGTSTLDGLSLAWSIAEHLARRGCRTLFATHYHELTQLAERFGNVINLNVTVREWQGRIVFLHRIVPGATNRSYGIHVARIAGLPQIVVKRADELLAQLAVSHNGAAGGGGAGSKGEIKPTPAEASPQMSLFTEYMNHPVVDELRDLDLTTLTPMEAFDLLRRLQGKVAGEGEG